MILEQSDQAGAVLQRKQQLELFRVAHLLYACSVDRKSDPHDNRERVMSAPFDPLRIGTIELENRLALAPVKAAPGTRTGPGSR